MMLKLCNNLMVLMIVFGIGETHMELSKPPSRKSQYNQELQWYDVDYKNIFPMGSKDHRDYRFPCRTKAGEATAELIAGEEFEVEMAGDAPHKGGHCEWSISYDEGEFAVLKTIIGECLVNGQRNYQVYLPEEAPRGKAVLSWTWINREGNREFYMNCADVDIKSEHRYGSIHAPKMFVGNLPGCPTIPQFVNHLSGEEYYQNRPNVVVGLDENGLPFSNIIYNTSSSRIKPRGLNSNCPTPEPNLDYI